MVSTVGDGSRSCPRQISSGRLHCAHHGCGSGCAWLKKYRAIATIEVDYLTLAGGHTLLTNPKAAPGRRGRVLKGKALTYPAVSIRPKF